MSRKAGLFPTRFPSDEAGATALSAALAGTPSSWLQFLAKSPHRDGIALVLGSKDKELQAATHATKGANVEWMIEISKNRRLSGPLSGVNQILFETWQAIDRRLCQQLELRARELPPSGFILYLTEYLEWCLVIAYELAGNAPQLQLRHGISRPTALYDIYSLIQTADDEEKSIMRNVLKSPAKIVSHRGVMVHVDRYSEPSVFGPSIDTVYLNEVLIALLLESDALPLENAIEVGCGNGLLSTSVLTHVSTLRRFGYFDTSLDAIRCTFRNLAAGPARTAPGRKTRAKRFGVHGEFDPQIIKHRIDLLFSNPPYVPYRTDAAGKAVPNPVGGTELLELIVRTSPEMLADGGATLIVYSEMAQGALDAALTEDCELVPLGPRDGLDVLFDVEDVFEDAAWMKYLIDNSWIDWSQDRHAYRHTLFVGAVVRRTDVQVGTLAARVRVLSAEMGHGGR
jgi:methylase of polypeptide subunit release factors